ncbi:MAG: polysaccharide deacetylase family protein [bacterium]
MNQKEQLKYKNQKTGFKKPLKRILVYFLYYTRLYMVIEWIKNKNDGENNLVILMYHTVSDRTNDNRVPINKTTISKANFSKQMKYLNRACSVLPLDSAIKKLYSNKLPKNAVVVTIDDGFKGNLNVGLPILKRFNIPTTVFLTSSLIGNRHSNTSIKIRNGIEMATKTELNALITRLTDEINEEVISEINSMINNGSKSSVVEKIEKYISGLNEIKRKSIKERIIKELNLEDIFRLPDDEMLTWEDVKFMSENGITFGAHTMSHPILSKVPIEMAEKEISGSKLEIEKNFKKPVNYFAFPNGLKGDYNSEHLALLEKHGFYAGFSVGYGFNNANSNRFDLVRIPMGDFSVPSFVMKLKGIMSSP